MLPPDRSSSGVALLEIVEVAIAELEAERLWGRSIDLPAAGSRVEARAVDVAGWVLGRGAPAVAVELVHGGAPFRRVPVQAHRPDVAAESAPAAGRRR